VIIIFKKLIIGSFTILRSIYMVGIQAFNKRETLLYPDVKVNLSSRYRGRIILTKDSDGNERCVACGLCAVVCPVSCIFLQKKETKVGRWYPEFFRINFSRCIFCGLCEEACPTTAIQLIPDFEMSEFKRQNLVYEKEKLLVSSSGKYLEYNFYKISGISINGKKKAYAKDKKTNQVDVRSLLP